MLGILVQLALSWLIVWIFQKENLRVLGLLPNSSRLSDFGKFFLIAGACCIFGFLLRYLIGKETWTWNPSNSFLFILNGIGWQLRSVLYEELIFRGVLLFILIKRMGASKGILFSAIAFGIYHWFSYRILGKPIPMLTIFFVTGCMGWVLAYGYAKTFSLYVSTGIHFGWNLVNGFIFSQGAPGNGLLKQNPAPVVHVSWFTYIFIIYFPIAIALLICFFLIKRKKQQSVKA